MSQFYGPGSEPHISPESDAYFDPNQFFALPDQPQTDGFYMPSTTQTPEVKSEPLDASSNPEGSSQAKRKRITIPRKPSSTQKKRYTKAISPLSFEIPSEREEFIELLTTRRDELTEIQDEFADLATPAKNKKSLYPRKNQLIAEIKILESIEEVWKLKEEKEAETKEKLRLQGEVDRLQGEVHRLSGKLERKRQKTAQNKQVLVNNFSGYTPHYITSTATATTTQNPQIQVTPASQFETHLTQKLGSYYIPKKMGGS